MDGVFLRILNMSLAASVIGLAVGALRLLLKRRLPRWAFYLMWALVLARLLLPFSIPSPVSAFNAIPSAHTVEESGRAAIEFVGDRGAAVDFPTLQAVPMLPQGPDAPPAGQPVIAPARVSVAVILATIWVCGVILLMLYSFACYAHTLGRLRTARRLEHTPVIDEAFRRAGVSPGRVRLYRSGAFASPVVCGLIRPRLIFSELVTDEDIPHVAAHELTHVRRCDNLFKAAATLALYLHWFNPLIWWFYHWYVTDMEASCDEAVVRGQTADRRAYAYSLVNMAARSRSAFAGGFLAFGECALKERVQSIMNVRKTTMLLSILCAAVIAGLGIIFLTNPQSPVNAVTPPLASSSAPSAPPSSASSDSGYDAVELAGKLIGGILPDDVKRMTVEGLAGTSGEVEPDRTAAKEIIGALSALELSPPEGTREEAVREITIWRTGEPIATLLVGGDWLTIKGAFPELAGRGSVSVALGKDSMRELEDCFTRLAGQADASSAPAVPPAPSQVQPVMTAPPASSQAQPTAAPEPTETPAAEPPALIEENPPYLRIPYDEVAEMNLIDRDTHTSCAITDAAERGSILVLLNRLTRQEGLQLIPDTQGVRLLQIRLTNGDKYDYWCYSNLLVVGETPVADAKSVRALYNRFYEIEQEVYGQHQARAEWLGYMNAYRITSMELENGIPGQRLWNGEQGSAGYYEATASAQYRDAILDVAAKLKALTVIPSSAAAQDKASAPSDGREELLDRRSIRFVFENGSQEYLIHLYRQGRIDVCVDSISYYTSYQTTGDGTFEALSQTLAKYGM